MARHYVKAEDKPIGELRNLAATALQKCIRAEAAARNETVPVVNKVTGAIGHVHSPLGYLACVTCGVVLPYDASKAFGEQCMDGGHFVGRSNRAVQHDPRNINPQCNWCNGYRQKQEMQDAYREWMLFVYGLDVIEELEGQKHGGEPLGRDELVDLLKTARKRTREAEKTFRGLS